MREPDTRGQVDGPLVRLLLSYTPKTGIFTWRLSRPGCQTGSIPGRLHSEGYWEIGLLGRLYKAHRWAWLYVNDVWPEGVIDHRDGDRRNNRIANLRDVSRSVNMQNQRRGQSSNRSGLLGVTTTCTGRYGARITSNKVCTSLGTHDTAEAAHAAYLAAKRLIHEGNTL